MAISRYGIAYIMSTIRIIALSTRPPTKPAIAPHTMPSVTDVSVASAPIISETRPPTRQRTSRSRPVSSVPNRCQFANVGVELIMFQSAESKAFGSSIGPITQASVISSRITRLATAALLRAKRTRASCHGLRPSTGTASTLSSAGTSVPCFIADLMLIDSLFQ